MNLLIRLPHEYLYWFGVYLESRYVFEESNQETHPSIPTGEMIARLN